MQSASRILCNKLKLFVGSSSSHNSFHQSPWSDYTGITNFARQLHYCFLISTDIARPVVLCFHLVKLLLIRLYVTTKWRSETEIYSAWDITGYQESRWQLQTPSRMTRQVGTDSVRRLASLGSRGQGGRQHLEGWYPKISYKLLCYLSYV